MYPSRYLSLINWAAQLLKTEMWRWFQEKNWHTAKEALQMLEKHPQEQQTVHRNEEKQMLDTAMWSQILLWQRVLDYIIWNGITVTVRGYRNVVLPPNAEDPMGRMSIKWHASRMQTVHGCIIRNWRTGRTSTNILNWSKMEPKQEKTNNISPAWENGWKKHLSA